MTCAKALSSGYLPISALLVSEPIWQAMLAESDKIGVFAPRLHLFRPSGRRRRRAGDAGDLRGARHPRPRAPGRAGAAGRACARLADHPLVGEARGVGLIGALELVADKPTKAALRARSRRRRLRLAGGAEAHGLIVRVIAGDIIAFSPPLIIEPDDIGEMLARFARALDDTRFWLRDGA